MTKICLKYLVILILGLALTSCGRQNAESAAPVKAPPPAGLTTLHQGDLAIKDHPDAPKLVYVDARDAENHAPHLAAHLSKALSAGKFRLSPTPSDAGYILHVNILKDGQVTADALDKAVKAGYGTPAKLQGSGTKAMLVDALMVQRRVPSAKRPSRQKMKNISSRNALGSNQMRLAVMSIDPATTPDAFSKAIATELALRMENKN